MATKSKRGPAARRKAKSVVLLSGGNPQIAKGEGNRPVRAYLAAIPGWKRDVGERVDALIERTLPGVSKAVKWNSPFYGLEGRGYFLSFHVYARYVKVAFFRGAALRPLPPGASRQAEVRYLDLHEGDELDEKQLASWVKQAAALPGWLAPATGGTRGANMKSKGKDESSDASRRIDERIADLEGWRGQRLARMRALVLAADPEIVEEWKWENPVWARHGIVCTGEAYKKVVKLTFARGAALADPKRLFNSSLEGHTRRAIDIHEGETIDERAFKALVKAAVKANAAAKKK